MNYSTVFQEPFSILESVIDISNSHENIEQTSRIFYNLKLIQRVVNIVIRDSPDDLAKTFDKGIHLSVNNRWLFINHAIN